MNVWDGNLIVVAGMVCAYEVVEDVDEDGTCTLVIALEETG